MNNEMKFEKNGLLILNSALEELGLAGISLSAWLGQDHILLMPQEMTALQLLHALEGLSRASVELLGVLQAACRRPCAAGCERNMDDVAQVPENIRPLLMLSGCCPSALAQLLEEGDIVYLPHKQPPRRVGRIRQRIPGRAGKAAPVRRRTL